MGRATATGGSMARGSAPLFLLPPLHALALSIVSAFERVRTRSFGVLWLGRRGLPRVYSPPGHAAALRGSMTGIARENTATNARLAADDSVDGYGATKPRTLRRGARHRRYTQSLLRKALDQARMGVDQAAINKLKGRGDALVPTPRAYASALGLELEVALAAGERRHVVEIEAGT